MFQPGKESKKRGKKLAKKSEGKYYGRKENILNCNFEVNPSRYSSAYETIQIREKIKYTDVLFPPKGMPQSHTVIRFQFLTVKGALLIFPTKANNADRVPPRAYKAYCNSYQCVQ
jgi:hypothetical protein